MSFNLQTFKNQTAQLSVNLDAKIAECANKIQENLKDGRFDRLPYFMNLAGKYSASKKFYDYCSKAHDDIQKEDLILYWARRLTDYSGDASSGRENDFRRSEMDGQKEAVAEILNLLEFGSSISL